MTASRNDPLRIGRVALTVHDLDGVGRFYREVVGLHDLGKDGESARLGAGDTVLLELKRDAHARVRLPRDAGLFHTAFLLPTRADLGCWVTRAIEEHFPIQGASDHRVSEAFYLADPEGNGVEIYADRPRETWPWSNGALEMATDPLDIEDLLRSAHPEPWRGAPAGTTIGHVHLQVGAIAPADAFYGGVLGLDLMARYPGASFFSSGGYHHHLGANIWNSRGAAPRVGPSTGLADVQIRVSEPSTLSEIETRATAAGVAAERHSSTLSLRDPWGTLITLTGSEA